MTAENESTEAEAPVTKRRGPRKESDIRAEIEAQVRSETEERVRVEMETRIRAEMQDEFAAKERAAEKSRAAAAEARPIRGSEIDGDPTIEGSITVHFVDDGLTLLGKVWYRGEELTINPHTNQWNEAVEVLTLDEFAQEERWGRRFFRMGLWRGKHLDEIDDESLDEQERLQLAKAAKIREERYGALAKP